MIPPTLALDLPRGVADRRTRSLIQLARVGPPLRDGTTHCERVALYARATGAAMGLSPRRCDRLGLAGLLHDVGKAAVPEAVLSKPGPLSLDEYALVRRHPEIGAEMLSAAPLADVRAWTLAHHERPDGHGYPNGLVRRQIPVEALIIAVADAYCAMTEPRPYRGPLTRVEACGELALGAGTQFDAEVAAVFVRCVSERVGNAA